MSHIKGVGGNLRNTVKFAVQGHRLTKRLRPTTLPFSHHHITIGVFITVCFITKNYRAYKKQKQNNLKIHFENNLKNEKQFEDTEQALDPDMTGMLKFSDREFRTTMINMLRV